MTQFSFNTKWGRIYADEHTTVEQIMQRGVPKDTAESLLAIAHAAVKHTVASLPPVTTEVRDAE